MTTELPLATLGDRLAPHSSWVEGPAWRGRLGRMATPARRAHLTTTGYAVTEAIRSIPRIE
jgi:hypothetical protein